jgi:transposase-like protein
MSAMRFRTSGSSPDAAARQKPQSRLRPWYPASGKLEIIRLVEQSHLPARRTLEELGILRSTFYRWYGRYRAGGPEALEDRPSTCAFRRSRPWIPSEAGRLYRLKPAKDSDDPGRLPRRALATTSSSGQLAGSSSSF